MQLSVIVRALNLALVSYSYRFPRVFGDEFSEKFGEKFGDSQNLVNNLVIYSVTKLVNHQFW